jgi:outer membrane lipoprotein SlyB
VPAGAATGKAMSPKAPVAKALPSTAAEPAAPVVSCANCGVVESVTAVERKGEGSGVGAVAGTVVGGALGNQVGKGNGRTAMTVLGAIGGAVAGHEVEKRARSTTVYRVKVRTDGGELRTVEHASAPAVGQRVKVEGQKLQMLAS